MSNSQKFYAVKKGRKTGIFNTWSECKKYVENYKGAIYKSFLTLDEAQKFLENKSDIKQKDLTNKQINLDVEKYLNSGYLVSFVDGSYDHRIKRFGYGVLIIRLNENKEKEYLKMSQSFDYEKFLESRNVSGEIFGVIELLKWCIKENVKKIRIYYDYEGIEKWFKKSWKANTNIAKYYVEFVDSKCSDFFDDVSFVKVLAHSNIEYNEVVDMLAKQSLRKKR